MVYRLGVLARCACVTVPTPGQAAGLRKSLAQRLQIRFVDSGLMAQDAVREPIGR